MRRIHDEVAILAQLVAEGYAETPSRVEGLRLLAERGDKLRTRYLNSCNHAWATTDHYEAGTEELEDAVRGLASRLGLHLFLQTDPRGAVVYVSPSPIPPNGYSQHALAIFPVERGE